MTVPDLAEQRRALGLGPATIGLIYRWIGLVLSQGKTSEARDLLPEATSTLGRILLLADRLAWLIDSAQLVTVASHPGRNWR